MTLTAATTEAGVSGLSNDIPFPVLIDRAKEIALKARERATQTEGARSVVPETIEELKQADLMRAMVPVEWGGLGRTFAEFCEITYTLGQGCASTAWVYAVLAGHAFSLSEFPNEILHEIWGEDPNVLASSAYAPTGGIAPVEGGYSLNGRFPFSSGSDHAQWSIVGALTFDENGQMAPRLILVPRTDFGTHDDWHTVGLAGTGSRTLVAEDVFVPSSRVFPFPTFKSFEQFALQSAIVGIAQGAVDSYTDELKNKPAKMGGSAPRDSELFQTVAGQAWGDAMGAWTLLIDAVKRSEAATSDGGMLSPEVSAANRAITGTISRLIVNAVERLYELSGGNGIYDNHLSRAFRDVRSGTQHFALNFNTAGKMAGGFRFDIPPVIPGL